MYRTLNHLACGERRGRAYIAFYPNSIDVMWLCPITHLFVCGKDRPKTVTGDNIFGSASPKRLGNGKELLETR